MMYFCLICVFREAVLVQLAFLIKSFFKGEAYATYFKQGLGRLSFTDTQNFCNLKLQKKKDICMFNFTQNNSSWS